MTSVKQDRFQEIREEYLGVQESYNNFQQDYSDIDANGELLTYWDLFNYWGLLTNANSLWEEVDNLESALTNISSLVQPEFSEDHKNFLINVRQWKDNIKTTFYNGMQTLETSHPFNDQERRILDGFSLYHRLETK